MNSLKRYGAVLFVASLMRMAAVAAITFVDPGAKFNSNVYQQTKDAPCVIGDQSCNSPQRSPSNWFYDAVSGTPGPGQQPNMYDLLSDVYQASSATFPGPGGTGGTNAFSGNLIPT